MVAGVGGEVGCRERAADGGEELPAHQFLDVVGAVAQARVELGRVPQADEALRLRGGDDPARAGGGQDRLDRRQPLRARAQLLLEEGARVRAAAAAQRRLARGRDGGAGGAGGRRRIVAAVRVDKGLSRSVDALFAQGEHRHEHAVGRDAADVEPMVAPDREEAGVEVMRHGKHRRARAPRLWSADSTSGFLRGVRHLSSAREISKATPRSAGLKCLRMHEISTFRIFWNDVPTVLGLRFVPVTISWLHDRLKMVN